MKDNMGLGAQAKPSKRVMGIHLYKTFAYFISDI